MSRIQLELEHSQAEAVLAAIEQTKSSKTLKAVETAIKTKLSAGDFEKVNEKNKEQNTEFVDNMTNEFVKTLLIAKKRGITKEAISFISSAENVYWAAHLAVEKEKGIAHKSLSKETRATDPDLDHDTFKRVMAPFERKLVRAADKFLTAARSETDTPLEVSEDYTHAKERQRIAKNVFNKALSAGGLLSGHWDDQLRQISEGFSCMAELSKFSSTILKGNPSKIDLEFNYMQEASQEHLGVDFPETHERVIQNVERVKPQNKRPKVR